MHEGCDGESSPTVRDPGARTRTYSARSTPCAERTDRTFGATSVLARPFILVSAKTKMRVQALTRMAALTCAFGSSDFS